MLLEKVLAIGEKMNLGKLTMHTAAQYIDRMLYLHQKDLRNQAASSAD